MIKRSLKILLVAILSFFFVNPVNAHPRASIASNLLGINVEELPTSLTAGSVIFSDGSNLTEDNTNFNYQDSTNDLTVTGKHIFDSDSDSYLRYNTSTGVVELFVDGTKQVQWPIAGAAPIDIVLLETGDGILLENGVDSILLE